MPAQRPPFHLCRRWGPYREGVVKRSAVGQGSWLDVGLDRDAHVPQVGLNQMLESDSYIPWFEVCRHVVQHRQAWGGDVHAEVCHCQSSADPVLSSLPPAHRQAAKQGVRLTLAMGEQPSVVTLQGQEVLQAALALPSGARRASLRQLQLVLQV